MTGFLIGRVRGIDIRVNWSVLVIGWLVAWSLAAEVLPEVAEGQTDRAYWIAAVVTTVMFLAGLVAHELGHSLVALRHDVEVRSITLWLFGGVAQLGTSPPTPRAAFRIAVAGPTVSVILGALGLLAAVPTGGLVSAAAFWFGSISLLLALFNLLPAFPLDGGRIYQAWLWGRGEDEDEATQKAAALGHTIGGLLIALGVVEILFAGAFAGLWLMALGWFLREAARAEAAHARMVGPLHAMTVSEVMTPRPLTVHGATTVESFVAGTFFGGRHAAYPVVDDAGAAVGLVTLNDLRAVPRDIWHETPVAAVATPLERLITMHSTDTLDQLADRMGSMGGTRGLVIEPDGRLVGIVAPSDIARLLTLLDLTGTHSLPGHARSPKSTGSGGMNDGEGSGPLALHGRPGS